VESRTLSSWSRGAATTNLCARHCQQANGRAPHTPQLMRTPKRTPTLRPHHGVHTKPSIKPDTPDVPHQQNDRIVPRESASSPWGTTIARAKKIAQRTPTPSSDTDFQSFSQSDISKNVTVTRMFGLPEATAPRRAHRHPIF
jgi:hypothetical protein